MPMVRTLATAPAHRARAHVVLDRYDLPQDCPQAVVLRCSHRERLETPPYPILSCMSRLRSVVLQEHLAGLDHMKEYTCGKKIPPTFQNRSMPVKSMAKANHSPKYGECL